MTKIFSNPAFQTTQTPSSGFNLVSSVNTFTSIFNPKSLDPHEEVKMKKLIFEASEETENAQFAEDFQYVKTLTSEIRGIQKQNLVLIGERIEKVRVILKNYKDGIFTKWLQYVFASKQTGYNILAYYLFLIALPENLQEVFKKLPQKTAYVLASREGAMQAKVEILQDPTLNPENILPAIRERLPLAVTDKRATKGSTALLIDTLFKTSEKLRVSKTPLNKVLKEKLIAIRALLDEILHAD